MAFTCKLSLDPTRKILVTGSVPTENLPKRSHEIEKKERRPLVRSSVESEDVPSTSSSLLNLSAEDALKQLKVEPVAPWVSEKQENGEVDFKLWDGVHGIAKYAVNVNTSLEFTVFNYNWPIPEDHAIYTDRRRSVRGRGIKELLSFIENSNLCDGLPEDHLTRSVALDPTSDTTEQLPGTVIRHSVPKCSSPTHFEVSVNFRSVDCQVIMESCNDDDKSCGPCTSARHTLDRAERKKSRASSAPAKSKASLSACGPEKLRATVIETRLKNKELEAKLELLQSKIDKEGVDVSESLEKDLLKIMGGQNMEATQHMKFFWQEQMKLLQAKKMGRRYHPQIIRFALSLHGKSASAYRELRDSGALILPSERVLRDYKNYFKPKAGINQENIDDLRGKTSTYSDLQRYVALIMDEMKIQSNLVFDKYSGDLIGFIDLGDPMTNFANLQEEDTLASHALAFLVRGMCTDLKHVVAYFFTGNVTSFQLMPMFWKVVSTLELSLKLMVCAAVNDGASPNRKFFRLHAKLAVDLKCDVVYKTPNVFAMSRFIYFFPDSPHLIKTARNCLYNSGSGSCSRYMWNDGQYLLWRHIASLYYSDQEFALHTLPKLTLDHIVLTSYSKMKVMIVSKAEYHCISTCKCFTSFKLYYTTYIRQTKSL